MFSLDWVKEKAQIMGSAHLINDYVEYGEMLDKEVYILLKCDDLLVFLTGAHLNQFRSD